MKVRPLADRVLVRRLDDEVEKSKGGIIIPDTAKEKPQQGKIIAVNSVDLDGKPLPKTQQLLGRNVANDTWFKEAVSGKIKDGETVRVTAGDGGLVINGEKIKAAAE